MDVPSTTAEVAPEPLEDLAILSNTTDTLNRGDLKPCWKPEKRSHFSMSVINKSIIYKFFKDFSNIEDHRRKTNSEVVFHDRPLPNILKYKDHN